MAKNLIKYGLSKRPRIPAWLPLAGVFLAGCVASTAPSMAPVVCSAGYEEAWTFPGSDSARKLITPHYVIYTTIQDDEIVQKLGLLMEGALSQYEQVAPGLSPSDRPLESFLFDNRRQWAQFTQAKAGDDARIYLQINRGGYTAGDTCAAYFIGDLGTYSVAAHEGWHQFLARHFRTRPPPSLEEGLACLFEDVKWDAQQPRWDLSSNPTRLASLRRSAAAGTLIPLGDLVGMHAGQVVDKSPSHIEAFYAGSWAFARFCREARGGKFRPSLEKLLDDCARGDAYPTTGPIDRIWHWDRTSAKPLLERYLGEDFGQIDREYQDFVRQLLAVKPPDEPPE